MAFTTEIPEDGGEGNETPSPDDKAPSTNGGASNFAFRYETAREPEVRGLFYFGL